MSLDLAVDQVALSFDCPISGLTAGDDGGPRLCISLGPDEGSAERASFQITYKNSDPPEGLARINDAVLRKF